LNHLDPYTLGGKSFLLTPSLAFPHLKTLQHHKKTIKNIIITISQLSSSIPLFIPSILPSFYFPQSSCFSIDLKRQEEED
jgi:hypothetical protein